MSRLSLFAVAATAVTVAGLAVPVSVDAAPTARSAHSVAAWAGSSAAVQWMSRPGESRSGIVHYANGLTARFTQRPAPLARSGADRQRVERDARAAVQRAKRELDAWQRAPAAAIPDASVSGTVTDAAGHPLAGVKVRGYGRYSAGSLRTITDPAGRYQLDVPVGNVSVGFNGGTATGGTSDDTGYVGTFEGFELAPGEVRTVDAALRPGAQVRIRVTDRAGNPLAGVGPYLRPIQPYVVVPSNVFGIVEYITTTHTAADGTITFRGVSRDASLVCVQAIDKQVSGGSGDASGYADKCSREPIAPPSGTVRNYPTIRLAAGSGGAVTGVVTDAVGTPISDALVEPFRPGSEYPTDGDATTAADGSYRLDGIKPGTYRLCVVGVRKAGGRLGYRPGCEPDDVRVSAGAVATASAVHLSRGGAITGTVTGPSGGPVAGVQVYASRGDWAEYAYSDGGGHYRVKGMPAGSYHVCFDTSSAVDPAGPSGDRPGCYQHKQHFAVHEGAVRAGIDGQLKRGGAIAGHLTGRPSSAMSDVEVEVEARAGHGFGYGDVDSTGSYHVRGLPAGSYDLCVLVFVFASAGGSQHCPRAPVDVSVGATTTLDVSLAPDVSRGSIEITVRDEAGRRVEGVDVAALKQCSQDFPYTFECGSEPVFGHRGAARLKAAATVDNSGRAELAGLKPGNYAVCLFAYYGVTAAGAPPTGYSDRCVGRIFGVTVSAGASTRRLVTLHPGGLVTGRVVDAAGHPLTHALVHVSHSAATNYLDDYYDYGDSVPDGPSPLADSFTRANGQFSIRGVRPGTQTVCVRADRAKGGDSTGGYLDQCVAGEVTVTANAGVAVPDITLPAGSAITGTVRNSVGHRLRGTRIEVYAPGRLREVAAAYLDRGPYRISSLMPGSYLVCFDAYRYKVECYHHVRWHVSHQRRPPPNATQVVVQAGETRTEINATLQRRG